jgi:RNA polymerase sigma factor (sigma-70 family)
METVTVDVARETDAGLLVLIGAADASSDQDRTLAFEARHEFYTRHYGYVLAVLKKFAANAGTVVIDPKEFAAATFKKVFRCAGRFRDKSQGDPDKSAGQIRAYLGRAASNLAKDELNRISRLANEGHFVVLDEARDIPAEQLEPSDSKPTHPRALAALQLILDGLKPEERDILLTYGCHGFSTVNGRELPKEVREALARRTGYERSTIRQKWHRLSQRLELELEPLLSR